MKAGKKQREKAEQTHEIRHKPCDKSDSNEKLHKTCGVFVDMGLAIEKSDSIKGFSPPFFFKGYSKAATRTD